MSSISLLCEAAIERASWDDTTYSWSVDGVEVSNQTANLSADGRRLHLSGMRGHKYNCIASNSLGISIVHYIIGASIFIVIFPFFHVFFFFVYHGTILVKRALLLWSRFDEMPEHLFHCLWCDGSHYLDSMWSHSVVRTITEHLVITLLTWI